MLEQPAVLSLNQEAHLAVEAATGGAAGPRSNVFHALDFCGPVNVAALGVAVETLWRRHETFRRPLIPNGGMRLDDGSTRERERANPGSAADVPRIHALDLSHLGLEKASERARALGADEISRPFDLTRPPLLRTTLVTLEPNHHVLLLGFPDIAGDWWSLLQVVHELVALYAGLVSQRACVLPPLPWQYGEFASWQRHQVASGAFKESIEHWRRHSQAWRDCLVTPSELGFTAPTIARFLDGAGYQRVTLSLATWAAFTARARAIRATAYMALVACFLAVIYRSTGRNRLALWTNLSNRTGPETRALVGWVQNSHRIGIECAASSRLVDVVSAVRSALFEAIAHQHVPTITAWGAEPRALGIGADPPVIIDMAMTGPPTCIDELTVRRFDMPPRVGAGLRIFVRDAPDELRLVAVYPPGSLSGSGVAALLLTLRNAMDVFATSPSATVADVGR